MLVEFVDFNDVAAALQGDCSAAYAALEQALREMPLQLKASDQAGKQGTPIFDPVGTNKAIKSLLEGAGFVANHPVPAEFSCFGIDVDFAANGLIVEVQFSNYPFLINNLMRTDLFFTHAVNMPDAPTRALVLITKAHMFDASNSTLYFEQARDQLTMLAEKKKFAIPVRLIGLFAPKNEEFEACFNERHAARYSRTTVATTTKRAIARPGVLARSRCTIELLESEEQ